MGCNASQEEMPEDTDFIKSLPPAEQEIFKKQQEKEREDSARNNGKNKSKGAEAEQEDISSVDISRLRDTKSAQDIINEGPKDELLLRVCRYAKWDMFTSALQSNKNVHAKDRQVCADYYALMYV